MDVSDKQKVIDLPINTWISGLVFLAIALWLLTQEPDQPYLTLVPGGLGLLILLTARIKEITVDRAGAQLVIRSIGPIPGRKVEIPLSEVLGVDVESTRSSSSRSNRPTYRVVIRRRDGSTVALRNYYSSGRNAKDKKANEIRALLGLGTVEPDPAGLFGLASQLSQQVNREQQEALTGPQAQEHVTDGVRWYLQTRSAGGTGITRWFSPDVKYPGGFLYLAQKVAGQKSAGGGLFGGISSMLFRQSLSLYGFLGEDTPGLEAAGLLANPDPRLDPHFMGLTSDQTLARQTLSPWVIAPLADWAQRYPMETLSSENVFNQLAVLFSPKGMYLATLGTLIPEAVEELTALGVELVKAQSSQH
jgi:hypothetical protein